LGAGVAALALGRRVIRQCSACARTNTAPIPAEPETFEAARVLARRALHWLRMPMGPT
jgi:hypothetical protein